MSGTHPHSKQAAEGAAGSLRRGEAAAAAGDAPVGVAALDDNSGDLRHMASKTTAAAAGEQEDEEKVEEVEEVE